MLHFGFLQEKKMPSLPCSRYSKCPRGQWLESSTSFPGSQVTLQKSAPSLPAVGYSLQLLTEWLSLPLEWGGEMFQSPSGTGALRTGVTLHSCIFPLNGTRWKRLHKQQRHVCCTPAPLPQAILDIVWLLSAQLALPNSSPSLSISSINLSHQHPPLSLSPEASLADRTCTGDMD